MEESLRNERGGLSFRIRLMRMRDLTIVFHAPTEGEGVDCSWDVPPRLRGSG